MANMPVATLRIWEQRYGAVRPATAASGHRLYSPADVERVLLLCRLRTQGHAIGSIAGLSTGQLQRLCTPTGPLSSHEPTRGPLHLAVAGPALAARLRRPAVARRLARALAVAEVRPEDSTTARPPADLLLWQASTLPVDVPAWLRAVQRSESSPRVAVLYRFAEAAAVQRFIRSGAVLIREPADDDALALWLAALDGGAEPAGSAPEPGTSRSGAGGLPQRRYDDATLVHIATLSSTLACECPRHVAELLMQLSSFEAYSATCADRNPEDAQLHAYLQQVAGASRALFESAMAHLARHEGLPLR
jgi:DNA-binding transcriptional MerR regulator